MDTSPFIPWISPIITAVITYIKSQGSQKAADKAAEIVGEKATETTIDKGQKVLTWLRSKFDAKAQQALENVEQYPDDEDYQQKLVKETARLASANPAFAQELKVLAENVIIAQSGGVVIDNRAANQGAQGVFNAPVQFGNPNTKDTP